ncbi:MAG: methyltransferase domain-containing protein [Patulibacter sp.]
MPSGSGRFLGTRSLAESHRTLARMLRPGHRVLDVGCGTGAITRGIAAAVGPTGSVVGIDISETLIDQTSAAGVPPTLRYEVSGVLEWRDDPYDVVTAARVLQWLADPGAALDAMVRLTRPGGRVVVLDYNHCLASWKPDLPPAGAHFYDAFLRWRAAVGMDNEIADNLPGLYAACGLTDIEVHDEHEVTERGDADFANRIDLWPSVTATRGHQMVRSGVLTEPERAAAERDMHAWAAERAEQQMLVLRAVVGTRPA